MTRALYGLRIRQPIGGDFGLSGDLIRHVLEGDDWTSDVSRFGIDIWLTTTALTGGFAVCQARLGAKVHDPKDPGADLGPMVRQVVSTTLRLAVRHADRWLGVHGSHDVPSYGFERFADPPSLEVDVLRLLTEFQAASLAMGATWRSMLSRETATETLRLAERAGEVADAGRRQLALEARDGVAPTTAMMSEALATFAFPDDIWARVIYDLVIAARDDESAIPEMVAGLTPIYLGRVGAFVIENRGLTTDQAEDRVERQAREFEREKPYLVDRWRAGVPA